MSPALKVPVRSPPPQLRPASIGIAAVLAGNSNERATNLRGTYRHEHCASWSSGAMAPTAFTSLAPNTSSNRAS